jgi:hypothetical protein
MIKLQHSFISNHYYHKRRGYYLVCHVCGSPDPQDIPEEIRNTHSSAHHVCEVCTRKRFKERLGKKTLLGNKPDISYPWTVTLFLQEYPVDLGYHKHGIQDSNLFFYGSNGLI